MLASIHERLICVKDEIGSSEENKMTYDKLYEVYIKLYDKA